MARTGMNVDLTKLQSVITDLEDSRISAGNPYKSRNELFKEVAESEWGRAAGLSPVMVYIRLSKYNLQCKTPEKRRSKQEIDPGDIGPKVKTSSLIRHGIDLDDFFRVFESQGITVDGLASIMVNTMNPPEVNHRIRSAWGILRMKYAIPKFKDPNTQESSQETEKISENDSSESSTEGEWDDQLDEEETESYFEGLRQEEQRQEDFDSPPQSELDPATKNQILEVVETDPAVLD